MLVTSVSEYQDVIAEISWGLYQQATDFSRLYYIQGGEAYYRDNNIFFQFEIGKLYILPVDKNYMLYHNPKNRINHIYCHITTTPKITKPLIFDIEKDSFCYDAIQLFKKHIKEQDTVAILKCIDLIMSTLPETNFIAVDGAGLAYKIKLFIEQHLQDECSLNMICGEIGYSKTPLIRQFRESYGITPIQYLNQRRLEESIRLLRDGASIEEVSSKFQYSSPANFSAFFKKKYGLSPKNYLKMQKKDQQNAHLILSEVEEEIE